jgi:hypothetical protein
VNEKESFLLEINKLPFIKAIAFTISIVYCICLPIVVIYIKSPSLFNQLDIFKILLLALSFGTIYYLANLFLIILTREIISPTYVPRLKAKESIELAIVTNIGVINFVSIYLFCKYYLFNQIITVNGIIIYTLAVQSLIIIIYTMILIVNKLKAKQQL